MDNAAYAAALDRMLLLRYRPVAVCFLEDESRIPPDALRPRRDLGKHLATCQAFALARRNGELVAMTREDQWCWGPMVGYGMADVQPGTPAHEILCTKVAVADPEKGRAFLAGFPKLELGKYPAMVAAPLDKCPLEPDVLLLYCTGAQLRTLVWAVKTQTGRMLSSQFDAFDSCIHAVVTPMQQGEYRITLPDPGEYERALAGENELIFSVPRCRMEELMSGLEELERKHTGYPHLVMEMQADFPRPPFYNELFALWGLEQGEIWRKQP